MPSKWWIAILALLEAFEFLIILALIFSFFPATPKIEFLNPSAAFYRHPEQDAFLYQCFLFFFCIILVLRSQMLKKHSKQDIALQHIHRQICTRSFWLLLSCFAIYNMIVNEQFAWPRQTLYWSLSLSLASRILSIERFYGHMETFIWRMSTNTKLNIYRPCAAFLLIILIIYVPDLQALLAKLFMTGDAQRSNNTFMFGATYGYSLGLLPCVDVRSFYGVGLPIIWGNLNKWIFGEFNYLNITTLLMWGIIAYHISWYLLLRKWLNHKALALIAILLILQATVFGPDGGPAFYLNFNTTAVRFLFDVTFFFLIYKHLQTKANVFIGLSALACGLQLFYVIPTGACLMVLFYAYIAILIFIPQLNSPLRRQWQWLAVCALLPIVIFFTLIYTLVGTHIMTTLFWNNLLEQFTYSKNGLGIFPYFSFLKADPGAFLFACLPPLVYLISAVVSLDYIRKQGDMRFILIFLLAVYGLVDYQQFLMISSPNVLLRNGKIFIIIIALWLDIWLKHTATVTRHRICAGAVVLTICVLWANPHFIAYPNVFNYSKNPNVDPLVAGVPIINTDSLNYPEQFKLPKNSLGEINENLRTEKDFATDEELKTYFLKEFDFKEDVALINHLTPPEARVPLISSHEMPILIQAKRKPFFYVFTLICPRPMRMRTFPVDEIFSKENLFKTMRQIQDEKPEYIFVQNILLNQNLPAAYYFEYQGIVSLMHYVLANYIPYAQGHYLTALKRRP